MNERRAVGDAAEVGKDGKQAVYGVLLVVGAVLTVAQMAVHPAANASNTRELVDKLSAMALVSGLVHGGIMASGCLMLLGLSGFVDRLGTASISVRAGAIAYLAGSIALGAAATINGFIVSGLALSYRNVEGAALETVRPLLKLCHISNFVCDHIGVVGLSAGVGAWSAVLIARGARVLGGAGAVIALVSAGTLAAGRLPMTVHGFGAFVLGQSVWAIAVGVQMMRRRL